MSWPEVELQELCSPKQHKTIATKHLDEGGYPVFGANGKIGYYSTYTHEFPTIAITCRGATCGTVNVTPPKCYINGNAMALDNLRQDKADLNYLKYFFINRGFYDVISGSAQPQITRTPLLKLKIPLPPLEEQKRIAAILDQADAIVKKRQAALDTLNTLGQSIFYDMFGDPKKDTKGFGFSNLGSVCQFYSGNTLPVSEEFRGQSGGYFSLKVSDFNSTGNETKIMKAKLWSISGGSKAGTCPSNSIVFPKRGGAIGTNKKRTLSRPSALDPNLMGVAPLNNAILSSYIFAWFQTFDLLEIASGSSVPQLNKKDLKDLKIVTPPMKLQHDFLEIITKLDANIASQNKSIENAQALFTTLQQRAFRGEL